MAADDIENHSDSAKHRDWRLLAWPVAFIALNVLMCLALAVRASVSPEHREFFDILLSSFWPGAIGSLLIWKAVTYPFRFFELLTAVALSALAVAWSIAPIIETRVHGRGDRWPTNGYWLIFMGLISADMLLAGFCIGLHYCKILGVDTTWKRLGTVLCGMALWPSIFVGAGVPVGLVFAGIEGFSDISLSLLGLLWLASIGFIAANIFFYLKTILLNEEKQIPVETGIIPP